MKKKRTKQPDLLRKNPRTILFNTREISAIERFCQQYKIDNKSKFMREAIIGEILKKFDEDYPTLFEEEHPTLFSGVR
jgi:ABC-type dipeptide/oligopeptide/nickel transport system ATPase subunit